MKFLNENSMSRVLINKLVESDNLKEDAWDDNFVISALQNDRVYWKRKSDGKEIVTSFDIFTEPTDPTEWKSEEELSQYALEEDLGPAQKVYNKKVLNNRKQVNTAKNSATNLNEDDMDSLFDNRQALKNYIEDMEDVRMVLLDLYKSGKMDYFTYLPATRRYHRVLQSNLTPRCPYVSIVVDIVEILGGREYLDKTYGYTTNDFANISKKQYAGLNEEDKNKVADVCNSFIDEFKNAYNSKYNSNRLIINENQDVPFMWVDGEPTIGVRLSAN